MLIRYLVYHLIRRAKRQINRIRLARAKSTPRQVLSESVPLSKRSPDPILKAFDQAATELFSTVETGDTHTPADPTAESDQLPPSGLHGSNSIKADTSLSGNRSTEEIETNDDFTTTSYAARVTNISETTGAESKDILPDEMLASITVTDKDMPPDSDLIVRDAVDDQHTANSGAVEKSVDSLSGKAVSFTPSALVTPQRPYPVSPHRVKRSYTPKYNLSQHPSVSKQDLDEFLQKADLGELNTIASLTASRLDALLMLALKQVDLIGELPISAAAFEQITALMRRTFVYNSRPNVPKIWPALFVTSMVFCARYSDEDTRNFWTPYARLVWNLSEASQNFQAQCREHFAVCRKWLTQEYGFSFPSSAEYEGSVVRPVFHHAMIPFYLQDDFARWLAQNFEALRDHNPDNLPSVLRNDPSLNRVPTSLRRFIQDDETSDTAATLITHIAEATKLYLEGEENIAALMTNPIQRVLWREVQLALDEKVERENIRRGVPPKLAWVWSLENAELELRLTNVSAERRQCPDMCVWTSRTSAELSKSEVYQVLYPLKSYDGGWLVDEVLLAGGPSDGRIYVLSKEHDDESPDVLYEADVPRLPMAPILFFRVNRRDLGIPLDDSRRVTNGEWLVSMTEGIEIRETEGQTLKSLRSYYVPDLLRDQCRHTRAGLYSLQLPVVVTRDGQEILRLEKQPDEIGQPVVDGCYSVQGLSPRIPPAFTDLPIMLRIPQHVIERESQVTLSIKSNQLHAVCTLAELRASGSLTSTPDGHCTVILDDLFPPELGLYSVNLRRGLKSLLDEPVQFIFLPGMELEPPDPEQHYLPVKLPQVRLRGMSVGQVIIEQNRATCESDDEGVLITWHDLKEPECSLHLYINDMLIPLAWPINRTYAWVEGIVDDGTVRAKQRSETVIHVRGEPNQRLCWRIAYGNQRREFRLNARGQWDFTLANDTLIDMIECCPQTHVTVNLIARDSEWKLFEYVRKPDLQVQRATYDATNKQLILTCQVGKVREGNFRLQLVDTSAPTEEPLVVADFLRLEPSLSFRCNVAPRTYRIQILSSGELLDVDPAKTDFRVIEAAQPIQIPLQTDDVLALLLLPGSDYQRRLSDETGLVPTLIRRLAEINRPDEWIGEHGLLPAWAVLSHPLTLTTREHHVALRVYPEVASHKGRAGKGFLDLSLDGKTLTRVYAAWELLPAPENPLYPSRLEIRIPTQKVSGPFSTLNEDEMWPAYQCSRCGRIVGSSSGPYLKLSPSLLRAHRHGLEYQDKKERFRDIVYGYDLHVSASALGHESLDYVIPPQLAIDPDNEDDLKRANIESLSRESSPISVDAYRRAIAQWRERYHTGHRDALEALTGNRTWRKSFDRLEQFRSTIAAEPILAASNRLLDAIRATWSPEDTLMWLDRNMVLLALLLRSHTSAPYTHDTLRREANFTDSDLRAMLSLALEACPLLLEWALTWVELFRVHASS